MKVQLVSEMVFLILIIAISFPNQGDLLLIFHFTKLFHAQASWRDPSLWGAAFGIFIFKFFSFIFILFIKLRGLHTLVGL